MTIKIHQQNGYTAGAFGVLTTADLDLVSGGSIKALDIRVAGMHITSNYDMDGHFHIMVQSGSTVIRRGGAV